MLRNVNIFPYLRNAFFLGYFRYVNTIMCGGIIMLSKVQLATVGKVNFGSSQSAASTRNIYGSSR